MILGSAFKKKYEGKEVDVDYFPKSQPFQCYDLWALFLTENYGVGNVILRPTGYAQDIWENFKGLGLDKYFTKVAGKPELGDWAIWNAVKGSATPYSHVAMFLSDKGASIEVLGQNQPSPYVTTARIAKDNLLGYLRPKGGSMLTSKLCSILVRVYCGRAASSAEKKKWVGHITTDQFVDEVKTWGSHKAAVSNSKKGVQNFGKLLLSEFRPYYKPPKAPAAQELKKGIYEVK